MKGKFLLQMLVTVLIIGAFPFTALSAGYTPPTEYGAPRVIDIAFDSEALEYADDAWWKFDVGLETSDAVRELQTAWQDGRFNAAGFDSLWIILEGDYRLDNGKWLSQQVDHEYYAFAEQLLLDADTEKRTHIWSIPWYLFTHHFDEGILPGGKSYFDSHTITFRFRFYISFNHSVTGYEYFSPWSEEVSYSNKQTSGTLTPETPAYLGASSWAKPELDKAAEYGLLTDRIKGNMSAGITREEFAEIAVKFYEKYTGQRAVCEDMEVFADTQNPEIFKAYSLGIVSGTDTANRLFAPEDLITREQLAVMLYRLIKAVKPDIDFSTEGAPVFADGADISNWAAENVMFMTKHGFIGGIGNNTFAPKASSTREQAAAIAVRVYEKYSNTAY